MTAKQMFEYALIELNKREAPSLILEDYNYFINKAINQYINRMYNIYDLNQQKTDDLRVLKSSAFIKPTIISDSSYDASSLFEKIYEVELPDDYLHILNCVVEYKLLKTYKCYDAGTTWQQGAVRLTADMFSQIINNYYLRPTYKRPYFYINNVNTENQFPTSDSTVLVNPAFKVVFDSPYSSTTLAVKRTADSDSIGVTHTTDWTTLATLAEAVRNAAGLTQQEVFLDNSETPTCVYITGVYSVTASPGLDVTQTTYSLVERTPGLRYGNRSKVRMEIRYGKDNSVFQLQRVFIDYIRTPQFIRLSQEQIDEVEDNTQILEFPDYVCQEIVNELIKLLMENASDPRIQSHIPVNTSIANPAEQPKK